MLSIFTIEQSKVYKHMDISNTDTDIDNITFAMLKADAVFNGVKGPILDMIGEAGFKLLETKPMELTVETALQFYAEHIGRPYFSDLICSIRGTVEPMVLYYARPNGTDTAVSALRALIGSTNARKAEPHTIRARYGGHVYNPEAPLAANAIHASDSPAAVLREISIIFPDFNLESVMAQFRLMMA